MTTSPSEAQQRQHEQTCRALSLVIANRVSKNGLDIEGAIIALIDVLAAGVLNFAVLAEASEAEQLEMMRHIIAQLRKMYKVRVVRANKPMSAQKSPDKWSTH